MLAKTLIKTPKSIKIKLKLQQKPRLYLLCLIITEFLLWNIYFCNISFIILFLSGKTTTPSSTNNTNSINAQCGRVNRFHKIVGGNVAEPNEYPHQVELSRPWSGGLLVFCGGSIITTSYILTAAHCTFG